MQSIVDRQKLIFPAGMLGVVVVGLAIAIYAGVLNVPLVLVLGLVGAFGGKMLSDELTSETLTLDRAADQIRCDRKTLWGTQRWQFPLSTLQDISVVSFSRRRQRANGDYRTRSFYSLKFVAHDASTQELLYSRDGDRMDRAYRAIREFLAAAVATAPHSATNLPSGKGLGLVRTSTYEHWREAMFNLQPEQVGGSSDDRDRVYGVLMDVGMLDESTSELWAISMSAFLNGEASFYPTPGGAVNGLGQEPQVAAAAHTIVQLAQTVLPKTFPVHDQTLPDQPDLVQFWLFTPDGVYGVSDDLQQLQSASNPLGQLFRQFSLIRQFAEQCSD